MKLARYEQEIPQLRLELRRLRAENDTKAETIRQLQLQLLQINLAWSKYYVNKKRESSSGRSCAVQ